MPSGKHSALRLATVDQIPQQYAKPIRKTAYLMPHPHIIHGGKMMPGESREWADVLKFNHLRNDMLTDLKMSNEVNFSAGRVMDVRGMHAIP